MLALAVAFFFLAATTAQAQTPFSSLLFTSSNVTSNETGPIDYAVCQTEPLTSSSGNPATTSDLASTLVNAVWFGGGQQTKASDFTVQRCSALALAGGRTIDVFRSSTSLGDSDCKVSWIASTEYLTALVNLSTADSFWSVSLPRLTSSLARTSCYGTRSECLLASSTPCNTVSLLENALPSFFGTGSAQCALGEPSPDYYNNDDLLYGLQAKFYPKAFPGCKTSDSSYSSPNLTALRPAENLDRCQAAPDFTATNTSFPSEPPLPEGEFTSCYAVSLNGYINIENNTDLQFLTPSPVPEFYYTFRVCLRFSNIVQLTLDGQRLIQSTSGPYDAALTCLDLPSLPIGLLPFNLQYAVPPGGLKSTILQLYVIPVSQVAADSRPGRKYQVTYECDCCGLFASSGGCCEPIGTCSYRTPTCGSENIPSPPYLSPPLLPPTISKPSPPVPLTIPPASSPSPTPSIPSAPTPSTPSAPTPTVTYPPYVIPQAPQTAPTTAPAPHKSEVPSSGHPVPGPTPLPTLPPVVVQQPPQRGSSSPTEGPPNEGGNARRGSRRPAGEKPPPVAPTPEEGPPKTVLPPKANGPYPPLAIPPTPPALCPCPDDKSGRRKLGEDTPGAQQTREDVTFAKFQDLVAQAISWDNLEAMLQA